MTQSSQTVGGRTVRGRSRDSLDTFGLIATAFRQVQAHWRGALCLYLVGVALHWGTKAVSRGLGEAVRIPMGRLAGNLPGVLVFSILSAVAAAVLGALTLRLFVAPQTRWWRPDRNLAVASAILALAAATLALGEAMVALATLGSAVAAFADLSAPRSFMPGLIAVRMGLQLALLIGGLVIYSHLVLWPAGAAVGDRSLTPVRSWRLMGAHAASYVGTMILLGAPVFLWTLGSTMVELRLRAHIQPGSASIVALLISPATQILGRAVAANLYGALAAAPSIADVDAGAERA